MSSASGKQLGLGIAGILAAAVALAMGSQAAELTTRSNGICKTGFDTSNDDFMPPDYSYFDNPPASSVIMKKPCRGAVSARFTAFVDANSDGQIVLGSVEAKCLGDGGYANGCTKGQEAFGQPPFFYLAEGPEAQGTHSMEAVFENVPPGKWRFRVRLGNSGAADLRFRAFTVKAYQGG